MRSNRTRLFIGVVSVLGLLVSACGDTKPALDHPRSSTASNDPKSDAPTGDDELHVLWDACDEGDFDACERLYLESPSNSDFERFGDTCGGRTGGGGCVPPTSVGRWAPRADAACAEAFNAAGRAPQSQSGDYDDDMALFSWWQSKTADAAAEQLTALGAMSGDQQKLRDLLRQYASLSGQAAVLYSQHLVFSARLTETNAALQDTGVEISASAAGLDVPACSMLIR